MVEHLDLRIVTAAGVSSGIDMALRLVELLVDTTAAQAAQLMIEYDPAPPVDSGSVAKASEATMARAAEYAAVGPLVGAAGGRVRPAAQPVQSGSGSAKKSTRAFMPTARRLHSTCAPSARPDLDDRCG